MHTATKSARSPMSVTFGTQRSTLITRPPLRWDACFCKAIVTEAARDLAAVNTGPIQQRRGTGGEHLQRLHDLAFASKSHCQQREKKLEPKFRS